MDKVYPPTAQEWNREETSNALSQGGAVRYQLQLEFNTICIECYILLTL